MLALSDHIAVIGAGAVSFADSLARYFADVIVLPPYPSLDRRIASHPDTLLSRVGKCVVVSEDYADYAPCQIGEIAAHIPVCLGKTDPHSPYPHDVAYNVFSHGNRLYGRTDTLDGMVLASAEEQGIAVRHVRQGYAGCSAFSCGNFVLTADPSIEAALLSDGASVVRLTAGGICLPGYDCGFIGGAAGYCAHTAFFFGDVEKYPDGKIIRESFDTHGIEAISLGSDMLTDYGGIFTIPLETTCK